MNDFDERLHRRLSALDAAVPARSTVSAMGGASGAKVGRSVRVVARPPIGLAAALAALLVGATVVGVGLQHSATAGPTASSAAVSLRPNGLPAEIDGQPVYRVSDVAEWEKLTGSFLLAATGPNLGMPACFGSSSGLPAEDDLLAGFCGGWSLGSTNGDEQDRGAVIYAAPKSPPLATFIGWANRPLVLRVHTHDTEAARCSAAKQAACEAAVVVEAVVWPTVPVQIGGENVYSGSDLRSMFGAGTYGTLRGSFLLGGVVSVVKPNWAPGACATATTGQQVLSQLISDCVTPYVSVDGVAIAPMSGFQAIDGRVVVVRAHLNDPLAAQCQPDSRASCEEAVVVDSIVWSSDPYAPYAPAPLATPTGTLPAPTNTQ